MKWEAAVQRLVQAIDDGEDDLTYSRALVRRLDAEQRAQILAETLVSHARGEIRYRTLRLEAASEYAADTATRSRAQTPQEREPQVVHGSYSATHKRALPYDTVFAIAEGCECETCAGHRASAEQYAQQDIAERREAWASFNERWQEALAEYTEKLKIEWTRELLDAPFAMPDGRYVKWGTATVAEHRVRAQMLIGNATSNAAAAARHQRAIQDIEDSGVDCLNAAMGVLPLGTATGGGAE